MFLILQKVQTGFLFFHDKLKTTISNMTNIFGVCAFISLIKYAQGLKLIKKANLQIPGNVRHNPKNKAKIVFVKASCDLRSRRSSSFKLLGFFNIVVVKMWFGQQQ